MSRKFASAVLGMSMIATVAVVGASPPGLVSAAAITSDDFTSGTLAAWTDVTRATVDNAIGSPAAPSMRLAPSAQSAFAAMNLVAPVSNVCVSVNVNLASFDPAAGVDLFRLRTAANGGIIKVFMAANGTLQMRNDLNPATRTTTTQLGTGWHDVELCGTVGAATAWTLYHDGALANTWTTDTGTTAVGRIQVGDASAKTFVANVDHFVVDQAPGDEGGTTDTTPPTVPGRPTGTSPSSSTIQVSWTASTDASAPISYRVYRDGAATPVGATTSLSFTDTGLAAGSSHTYTVDAVDTHGNASAKTQASLPIVVQSGGTTDTTPPSVPGRPTGSSPSSSTIQVGWTASTDPSTPITYRLFRDGGINPIGTTTALSMTDTGLNPGSSHTYTVDAVDAAGNVSARSQVSTAIVVQQVAPAVIVDEFGSLSAWTVTRLTVSTTTGSPSAPSARAEVTNQAAYAVRALPATMGQACVSMNVNLASGTAVDLFRLRTAANGALVKVFVGTTGTVQIRNDLNPATRTTTTQLGSGWHNIELCGTVGAATSWTLYRDGAVVTTWTTDTGTTPIGRIQIGHGTAKTFTANFDHFVVDTAAGDAGVPPGDTTPPTIPGRPTGSSPSSTSIQISWTASTDPSAPISYFVYRDAGADAVGTTTSLSFTDTGLAGGSAHTYTVAAVDGAGNVSAKSQPSATVNVQPSAPPVVVDEFANLSGWTVTRLSLSNTAGSPGAPSARADVTNQSAFGIRTLPATMRDACVSVNVNLAAGTGVDLFRLRTATNGPLIKVFVGATGTVQMHNDLNPATRTTTTQLGTGWHNVELCGTVGAATSWSLYRDGVLIITWATNTGTAPIGQIQLGHATANTFTANFDHFVVDTAPGDS